MQYLSICVCVWAGKPYVMGTKCPHKDGVARGAWEGGTREGESGFGDERGNVWQVNDN